MCVCVCVCVCVSIMNAPVIYNDLSTKNIFLLKMSCSVKNCTRLISSRNASIRYCILFQSKHLGFLNPLSSFDDYNTYCVFYIVVFSHLTHS